MEQKYDKALQIKSNKEVLPGIFLLTVEAPVLASCVRPGQFCMISCDSGIRRLLRRPISVHGICEDSLEFLFTVVGEGTRWLSRRQQGDEISILGPLGNGFSILPSCHHLLIVAGGMGIAPLKFLAVSAAKGGFQVKLLAGARTSSLLYIPRSAEFETRVTTEDGTAEEKGLVTDFMPDYLDWADQVFICGPLPMYKSIAEQFRSSYLKKQFQVSLELRMGCGLGVCYSCTVKTRSGLKQVCKDGPVFDMQDILWEAL